MKPRLKKEAREIVTWAEARGWRLDPRPNGRMHWVLCHLRTGAKVSISATTSDRRNTANAMAKMKRLERGGQSDGRSSDRREP